VTIQDLLNYLESCYDKDVEVVVIDPETPEAKIPLHSVELNDLDAANPYCELTIETIG
jgi:hypothetical protein